jgi:4-hydroxythreonine-4-phosphate dehydrogenase (EC 1.1.1.262)
MTTRLPVPRIALTPGEPAGIGPDLCIQLAQQDLPCEIIVIASPQLLEERAGQLGLPLQITEFDSAMPATPRLPDA